jgi:uncharacterized membrane protein YkvA (DUF1232 family)
MTKAQALKPGAASTISPVMTPKFSLIGRILTFRRELGTLWSGFLAPQTPMRLKFLMLLVPLYLISPLDLIPDFIPIAGWLDDMIVIPMLVSWIVSMLPRTEPVRPSRRGDQDKVIDGSYRRL